MKIKKIALVTCYYQPNFGSQLQAYATQLAMDQLGVSNETIMFDGLRPEINKAKYKYFLSRIFDINTVKDKMATVRKVMAAKQNPGYAKNLSIRNQMFKDFASSHFHLSKKYNSKAEITKIAHDYAAFLVGSDQLWLPSNISAGYYTLEFVPDEIKKIAFATSFGISELPVKSGLKAQQFLRRIEYVSVRELSGQELVKKWADRDVPVVCDPTILFTAKEWDKALQTTKKGNNYASGQKYIFVYFLGNNPWERDVVRRVRKETGVKIVQLVHSDEYIKSDEGFADFTPYDVGPKEFVELIRDAEYVFTDSFHCSVFSMLNHKKFFTFPRYSQDGNVSTNGRLYSLLSLVRQESRIVKKQNAKTWNVKEKITESPDFDLIDEKLYELRQFTWSWLKDALKGCEVL